MKTLLGVLVAILVLCGGAGASEESEISLLDLRPEKYKVGFGDLWVGRNLDKKDVLVKGRETKEYLFAHAPSRMIYHIPDGAREFKAYGVRTQGDDNVYGSWFYIVKIDRKEAFRSRPLVSYEDHEVPIDVSIPRGSKEIELIVDDMTNGFADHSIWAAPKFIR